MMLHDKQRKVITIYGNAQTIKMFEDSLTETARILVKPENIRQPKPKSNK